MQLLSLTLLCVLGMFSLANAEEIRSKDVLSELDKQLLIACSRGDLERAKQLLNDGANPRHKEHIHPAIEPNTPLLCAIVNNHKEVAILLIEKGATAGKGQELNELGIASASGKHEYVQLILDHMKQRQKGVFRSNLINCLVAAIRSGRDDGVIFLINRYPSDITEEVQQKVLQQFSGEPVIQTKAKKLLSSVRR
ncbi:MAG: ankyrin repeat domain-containing protein [Prosthecobacter sp.]|nr:ankyrin repeat domain-containing protein [Prosthecobacter sp.]